MKRNRKENRFRSVTATGLMVWISYALLGASIVGGQPAQMKAAKFDEIELPPALSYDEIQEISESRIKRFVDVAKREKRFPYVLHYRARIKDERDRWVIHNLIFSLKSRFDRDDAVILDGGVREVDSVELWFVPKGGDFPTATPTFQRSEAIDCPSIYAHQADLSFDKSNPVILKVRPIKNVDSYDWSVSDGKIMGMNGLPTVEVDVSGAKSDRITAFLEVRGIHSVCKNTTLVDAKFGNTPRLLDRFGAVPNGDIRARLDAFLAILSQNSDTRGYVYNYGGRSSNGKRELEARRRLSSNHFRFRGFDNMRVMIVDAGYHETVDTELWIVPPGVEAPRPNPSVDSSFIVNRSTRRPRRR